MTPHDTRNGAAPSCAGRFPRAAAFLRGLPARALLLAFAGILLIAVVFFCRKPVILVTDKAFTALYGEKRSLSARAGLSLRIFRRVKTISMAEGAGPDLVEQGAASLSRRPLAVFFPYRYREGARRYQKNRPEIPVVVLAGRQKNAGPAAGRQEAGAGNGTARAAASAGADSAVAAAAEPLWLYTDTETDVYRAGAFAGAAGRFAEENPDSMPGKDIMVFETELGGAEKAVFTRGLAEQDWKGTPLFSSTVGLPDSVSPRDPADGVLPDSPETEGAAAVSNSLKREEEAPAEPPLACAVLLDDFRSGGEREASSFIIFSWMDPALAPRRSLAFFDDSPWTQIVPALGLVKREGAAGGGGESGGGFAIPSRIVIFRGDKNTKSLYTEVRKLKNLRYRAETADN